MSAKKLLQGVFAIMALGVASSAHALEFNMPKGVTPISHEVYGLHMMIFWICVVIGVLVFGVMIYSLIRHRKASGAVAAHFHESTKVEVTWTIIPFIILIIVAVLSSGTLLTMSNTRNSAMTIKVTGYQWLWEYDYLDSGVDIYSRMSESSNKARRLDRSADSPGPYDVKDYLRSVDHPMVVPVHEKIRLLITSGDVIHSWWVPDFGMKKDAIPGYINEMWIKVEKPGTYTGQCAELCGRGHAYMPIVVKAVPKAQFAAWVKKQGGHSANKQSEQAGAQPSQPSDSQNGQSQSDAGSSGQPAAAEDAQSQAGSQAQATSQQSGATSEQGQASADSAPQTQADSAGSQPAAGVSSANKNQTSKLSKSELMSEGKKVYETNCAACHKADGTGNPPTFPDLHKAPVVKGPVPDHIQQVLGGGKIMPAFKSSLSNEQIAAVVTFERNAFAQMGDIVQPADVQAQR